MKNIKLRLVLVIMLLLTGCVKNEEARCIDQHSVDLKPEDVQDWLADKNVEVPKDLASQIDVSMFVVDVLNAAADGIDRSAPVSYDVTIKFIQDIQHAAGYYFLEGKQTTKIICQ